MKHSVLLCMKLVSPCIVCHPGQFTKWPLGQKKLACLNYFMLRHIQTAWAGGRDRHHHYLLSKLEEPLNSQYQ